MTMSHRDEMNQDARLLALLQRLLTMKSVEMRPILDEASTFIAETFGADKVDIFLYEADVDTLVALGTSKTPMGERQHALGLNRLPVSNGGRAGWVFKSGEPYVSGRADQDPEELPGIVHGLGIHSTLTYPLEVDGDRRGVLQVDSAAPDFFTDADLQALAPIAGWIGLILHRAELVEQRVVGAEQRGRHQAGEEVGRLTRRQQDVAICLAQGLSNAQIGRRLTITEGTVANHIESMLRRLNLQSRTQIAVWAVERGLYRSDHCDADEDERSLRGRRGRLRDVNTVDGTTDDEPVL
jgi:DNA-binding CsgD family transcriptional regulator